jgi:outer membrane receptor protein involved in Fe transport
MRVPQRVGRMSFTGFTDTKESTMTEHTTLRRAVRYALLMSALPTGLHFATAVAQETAGQPEEMTVTGSRIVQPNLESISPVTSITSEDIGATGKVRVEDIINQLPQAFAAQGSNISNGATGTATVNLRGLGSSRTLVLVNGRRLMPGDPVVGDNSADLNQIPAALVKRVEVLTGGASAVYGADAVAGVVNFIMDTDFEGVRLEANYNFNQHHNDNDAADVVSGAGFALPDDDVKTGYARDVTFALGVGSAEDKGHAVFYATYRKQDAVLQAQYDYSACTLGSSAADDPTGAFTCAGSYTAFPGWFQDNNDTDGVDYFVTLEPGGGIRNYGADFNPSTDLYNFGPLNFYQRPDERYTAGVFTDYKLDEHVDVYGEFMYMNDRSVAQIAPSGSFFQQANINCNNPLLSPAEVQAWCTDDGLGPDGFANLLIGRRNVEGGGRQSDIGHESYRAVVGAKGQLTDVWSYDTSLQYGTTNVSSTSLNDFDTTRIAKALQTTDGVNCLVNTDADTANDDPACVPWNVFTLNADGSSNVSQAAVNYLAVPAVLKGQNDERVLNANLTADWSDKVKLPTADSGLAANFGLEYRHEESETLPDATFQAGNLAGSGGATTPVAGQFHVKDLFAEARLPLIQGKTGVQDLSLEAGYRYSDYSTDVTTDTYKYGLNYSPVDAVRFRGSFQRAVRAPNIGELFNVVSVALDGTQDPCAGAVDANGLVNGHTEAECALTGVTADDFGHIRANSASQYNGLTGGNPNLSPEKADTTSFGVVFQPPFVRNLVVALDYFDIDIEDVILGGAQADTYINKCLDSGDPTFCDLIHRDEFGSLWLTPNGYIVDTQLNLGGLGTKGVDAQASYAFDIGPAGRLGFSLIGTWLDTATTQPLKGDPAFDCVGFFGAQCGVPTPEWRHSLRTTWNAPWRGIDVSLNWRYFDPVDAEGTSSDPTLHVDGVPESDAHFASRSYIDATASITFADKYTVRVGANNLFDVDPPLVGQDNCPAVICSGNTYSQVYDVLGRQWFATLTMDF